MRFRKCGVVVTLALSLGLLACGGSEDDSSSSTSTVAVCPSLTGYQSIQAGMSYAQAVATLGCQGVLDQTAKRDNITQSYYWGTWATNYDGPWVYIAFVNGFVSLKSARFGGVAY